VVAGTEVAYATNREEEWVSSSGYAYIYGAGASIEMNIQYAVSNTSSSTEVRRARLEFWRVS
jgi:hypothetical protein